MHFGYICIIVRSTVFLPEAFILEYTYVKFVVLFCRYVIEDLNGNARVWPLCVLLHMSSTV